MTPPQQLFAVAAVLFFLHQMNYSAMIEQLRAETPGCSRVNHLNNAGASLPPAPVLQTLLDYLNLEAHIGGYEAADQKAGEIAGFYAAVASMLHSKAQNIAFASSATDAFSRALSAISWKPGDVVLTTNHDYVSSQISFLALQKRFGIHLLRARDLPEGGVDVEDLERLLKTYHPRLVAVAHVPTNSGLVQPVEAIGNLCRGTDTLFLVDACQSAGQMPLDVNRIGCDFLSATLRKFLRGPRGAGFLFVSDRVLEMGLEMMLPDMRGANWTGADTYSAENSAKRFEYWENPVALQLGGKAAVEYALNLGLDWIQEQVRSRADFARNQLAQLPGVRVLDEGRELSGIVTAYASHWDRNSLLEKLSRQGINCRISSLDVARIDFGKKGVEWALRVSPHYYNTEEEITRLTHVLQQEFPQ